MDTKVLTVAQQKGGAGKTTLAAHLAVAWAAAGRPVALIDIDPQGSLAAWYRARAGGADRPGLAPLHLSAVAGWRVTTELDRLRGRFALVVIDSPPHAATEARIAVRAADLVLVPVQPGPMDMWASAETLALARAERTPAVVVLNRVPPRGRLVDAVVAGLTEQGMRALDTRLGNRVAFAASMMDGLGVTEDAPRTAAATEIQALAREIEGLVWG